MPTPVSPGSPFRFSVPAVYAVVGVAWIVVSDCALSSIPEGSSLHTVKGILFVVVTALLLHTLVQWYSARMIEFERRLSANERMQMLGQLTARVSHDMRNVIMAAKSLSATLRRASDNTDTVTRTARHLDAALRRGELLLSELLEFGSARSAQIEALPLGPWMREYIETARHVVRDGVELCLDIPTADLIVEADPNQLYHLLTNLVINASEATSGPGTIELIASPAHGESPGTTLTVRDHGAGMTAQVARRVFEPLYTTKPKGTGLGLAIVERIVAAHGGRITVNSKPGRGTAFHVFFPTLGRTKEVAPATRKSGSPALA